MTTRPVLALALTALLTLAACGDASDATDEPTTAPSATPTEAPATDAPSEAPTPTVDTSLLPDPGPTEVPPSADPSGSAEASPSNAAAECQGTEENQAFFADIAAGVDWPVLCLAQDGWVITTGSYSLRGGGSLEIGYRGPGGATLTLREGYICTDDAPCAPEGTALGDVSFGELTNAQVIDIGDGELAVVADPDANPSWIAVSTGLDGDQLAELAATGFVTVGG